MESRQILVPFLKWAGGKRWLVSAVPDLIPTFPGRYIEPFLGSASIFFSLQPRRALLSDANRELIATYKAIKFDWKAVVRILDQHARKHSKNYYYEIREKTPEDRFERAARFIYLNRTCWNGLYRVNLKGEFNVPIGTKNTVILDTDDFEGVARILKRARLEFWDFEKAIDFAEAGDFIFADPPYTVKHNHNGFIKYNQNLFSWADQVRLAAALARARDRGVQVVSTNADHADVRKLYRGLDFSLSSVSRFSVLAANRDFRSETTELLIRSRSE